MHETLDSSLIIGGAAAGAGAATAAETNREARSALKNIVQETI